MARRDIVVVGASSGGLQALKRLVAGLPADFAGTLFVVLHTGPDSPAVLAGILERAGKLTATTVTRSQRIKKSHIYVPVPDYHLVFSAERVEAAHGPRENRVRPAVDVLFRSAALSFKSRTIGVVLTGNLDDGSTGLAAIKSVGGITIVQSPSDAEYPSMPLSALRNVEVDHSVALDEMPALLTRLVMEEADMAEPSIPREMEIETGIAREEKASQVGVMDLGEPSIYSCPECHGVMLKMKSETGGPMRFRCHTGHAYSAEALRAEMHERTEEALWSAIRAMQEQALLLHHMARHQNMDKEQAHNLRHDADEIYKKGDVVRQVVMEIAARKRS